MEKVVGPRDFLSQKSMCKVWDADLPYVMISCENLHFPEFTATYTTVTPFNSYFSHVSNVLYDL